MTSSGIDDKRMYKKHKRNNDGLFTHQQASWWRHQMETFSALLALLDGNPSQRPVTQSFDVFFDRRLNKRLSKQARRWWYETPSSSLCRHHNAVLSSAPLSFLTCLFCIFAFSFITVPWPTPPTSARNHSWEIIGIEFHASLRCAQSQHCHFDATGKKLNRSTASMISTNPAPTACRCIISLYDPHTTSQDNRSLVFCRQNIST